MPITDSTLLIDRANQPLMWGEIADLGSATIWKFTNTEAGQPFASATNTVAGLLLFGWGVVQGTGADGVAYPSAIADKFEGIVLVTDTFENRLGYSMDGAGRFGYPPAASGLPGAATATAMTASVIRKADRIGVPIETAVNRGDPVHMRCLIGSGVARGTFRASADGVNTQLITRARFLTTVAAPAGGTLGVGYISLEGVI